MNCKLDIYGFHCPSKQNREQRRKRNIATKKKKKKSEGQESKRPWMGRNIIKRQKTEHPRNEKHYQYKNKTPELYRIY